MFTRQEFEAWLRSDDLTREVGKAQSPMCCPLATHLHQNEEYVDVSVQRSYLFNMETFTTVGKLPAWAKRFLNRVDGNGADTPITAQEALDILATIPK